jgi:L,D-transpeptidase YcbB
VATARIFLTSPLTCNRPDHDGERCAVLAHLLCCCRACLQLGGLTTLRRVYQALIGGLIVSLSSCGGTIDGELLSLGHIEAELRQLLSGGRGPSHDTQPTHGPTAPTQIARSRYRRQMLERFYASRGYKPGWVGPQGALSQADDLLGALEAAAAQGLPPNLYRLEALRVSVTASRQGRIDDRQLARLDLSLSETFIVHADHLRRGLLDPRQVTDHWHVPDRPSDLAGLLTTSLAFNDVAAALERLTPRRLAYAELAGFLATAEGDELLRLEANLDRWRWLPRDLGDDYLLVRLAAFELDWIRGGVHQSSRRVIVGEPFRRTPSFASQITDIVVYPSWHVPASIARDELLPRARDDARFLRSSGFHVFRQARPVELNRVDWRDRSQTQGLAFVQAPGGSNPLGEVKFNLKNPFAIFLHDTPSPALFGGDERDLSHGCVRVEQAVDLARGLLAGGRGEARFESLLVAHKTGVVSLQRPLPVFFIYWTLDVVDGQLRRLTDVYGEDAQLIEAWRLATATAQTRSWNESAAP